MNIEFITRENKKGVFLTLSEWKALQKELNKLQLRFEAIDKRRKEIAANFLKSKKEKQIFSSNLKELKAMLK